MTTVPVTTAPDGLPGSTANMQLHTFARCWRITRLDGTILRFTDAAHPIDVLIKGNPNTNETFTPVNGMQMSAAQLEAGLAEQNFEAEGILDDSALSHDDLRAGLYQDAKIDFFLVNWSAPELGEHFRRTFWIERVVFDGEGWKADIVGLTGWMQRNEGDLYIPACQHEWGDSRCKVVKALFQENASVSAVTDQRKKFTTNVSVQPDNYWQFGQVTWTTGANTGVVSEIAASLQTGGEITLRLPTPYDIAASDQFSILPGCQKRRDEDCDVKYSNLVNYGGFPFVPGTDKLLEIPGQK